MTASQKRAQRPGCGERRDTAVTSMLLLEAWLSSLPCVRQLGGKEEGQTLVWTPLSPGFLICQMEIITAPGKVGLGLNGMTPGTYLMKGSDPKNGSNYYWVPVFSINYCIESDLRNNPVL